MSTDDTETDDEQNDELEQEPDPSPRALADALLARTGRRVLTDEDDDATDALPPDHPRRLAADLRRL